jgi:uncharacterized membrane protein YgaE (UPF0421/DUF939 family)
MNFLKLITAIQLSVRAALSAGIAVAIAQLLQFQDPLYALIGAVIVTDLSPSKTQQLALRRLVGTLLGAMVGATLSHFLPPGPPTIGFSILIAMLLSHLFHLQAAASVTGYVCGILVLNHSDHPWSYALYRVMETVLGIGVATLVSLFPKLIGVEKSEQRDS